MPLTASAIDAYMYFYVRWWGASIYPAYRFPIDGGYSSFNDYIIRDNGSLVRTQALSTSNMSREVTAHSADQEWGEIVYTNKRVLTFTTATEDWDDITHLFLIKEPTVPVWWSPPENPIPAVKAGKTLTIPIGDLKISYRE